MEDLLNNLREGFIQHGQTAAQNIAPFTVQIALALILFFVTRLIAHRIRRSVAKGLTLAKADLHVALLVSRSASIGVWCVGALVILGVFGVGWTAVAAALGVVGLAIAVALQDVLKNVVAGVYVLLERPFHIGDDVQVKDYRGTVEDVGLRTTALRSTSGSLIIIPNATIFTEVVVNASDGVSKEPAGVAADSSVSQEPAEQR